MSVHEQQLRIIKRLIASAGLPLKRLRENPSGGEGEEKRFGLECEGCGVIYISLSPRGPEPMEMQAFRQYQNHVTARHR